MPPARQQAWLAQHECTLLVLTLVVPGPVKDSALTRGIFNRVDGAAAAVRRTGLAQPAGRGAGAPPAAEGFVALRADAQRVKDCAMQLEVSRPIGRLWDIDVLDTQGAFCRAATSACRNGAACCAANRPRSAPASGGTAASSCCMKWKGCSTMRSLPINLPPTVPNRPATSPAPLSARCWWKSTSRPPGLVDRHNTGAHRDMDLGHFYRSARAIGVWLPRFIQRGREDATLPAEQQLARLRPLGTACETRCFALPAALTPTRAACSRSGYCAPPSAASSRAAPSAPKRCAPRWRRCAGGWWIASCGNSAGQTAGQRRSPHTG